MSGSSNKSSKPGYGDDLAIHDGSETDAAAGLGDLGDELTLDPLATSGERRKFGSGSLVLIAVVIVAAAGLWFMKTISRVDAGSGANNDIEATITKFLDKYKGQNPGGPDNANILGSDPNVFAVFSDSYVDRQVPLTNVARNPFILPGEGEIALPAGTPDDGTAGSRRRNDRKSTLERAGKKLELKSVVMSEDPLAIVSGKIVRKGDELQVDPEGIVFRVTEISNGTVVVTTEDEALELTVSVTLTLNRDR